MNNEVRITDLRIDECFSFLNGRRVYQVREMIPVDNGRGVEFWFASLPENGLYRRTYPADMYVRRAVFRSY